MRISDAARCLLCLVFAACLTNFANASVILGLMHDPPSTAGGGATSTRSGGGSWQLYAIDDSNTDFGISSYNIVMSGTTALNNRSPVTTITDSNGNPQTAGFSGLRSGTNQNPITASQALPGTTPFLITGFGQTASDFVTKATAIDAGAVVIGPTTSGGWGNYSSPNLTAGFLAAIGEPTAAAAVAAGKKWVFIAEGSGLAADVFSAVVTVYSNQAEASVSTPTSVAHLTTFPEPASILLLLAGLVGLSLVASTRRPRPTHSH